MKISVIGSGSWGTALAMVAARNGVSTLLWGPEQDQLARLARERCNRTHLGDYPFPPALEICNDFQAAIQASPYILIAVPSDVFGEVFSNMLPILKQQICISATKGLDPQSERFPTQIMLDKLGRDWPVAVLSGPSFAKEVAAGQMTAVVLASNKTESLVSLKRLFEQANFQLAFSDDLIGVQLGGTAKNVIAIATGIADGVSPSANTRAALITRGLAEIRRLGLALGAKSETFLGLAGLGDLVLTCSDDQSRNRRFGLALGKGMTRAESLAQVEQVVEGALNVGQLLRLASKQSVSLPIVSSVASVLAGEISPRAAVQQMLLSAV